MMMTLFNYKFYLTLLSIFFACSEAPQDAPIAKAKQNAQESPLRPLTVILGEDYPQKLFIASKGKPKQEGLFDVDKKEILPIIYDEIYSGFVNPYYVVVVENRRQGLFDLKGKRICESVYDGFLLSPSDSSILAAYLGRQEKWIVLDDKGKRIFSEEFSKIEFLPNGLVILQDEELKGSLATIKGNLLTKFEFDILQGIGENQKGGKWFDDNDIVAKATDAENLQTIYINSKGEIVAK